MIAGLSASIKIHQTGWTGYKSKPRKSTLIRVPKPFPNSHLHTYCSLSIKLFKYLRSPLFTNWARINYFWELAEDLTCSLSGNYREDDYVDRIIPREDKDWYAGVSMSYQILERLIATLDFRHWERDSTDDFNDFKDNLAFLTFSIPYEGRPIDFWWRIYHAPSFHSLEPAEFTECLDRINRIFRIK